MKREALNHPKMLDFASRLDIPRCHAIGILTLLFDFTAQYAPQGDVGKHRDGAISRACEWMGNPEEFIAALVESGWIDKSATPGVRLRVHDWPQHCEQWVKLKLQKMKLEFLPEYTAEATAEGIAEATAEFTAEASASRDPNPSPSPDPNPNQAQPITKPITLHTSADASACDEVLKAWNLAMNQQCKLTEKRRVALRQRLKDSFWVEHWRDAISKAAVSDFCNGLGDKGWVADFEWFVVRPDSVTKLIEGKYDNRAKPRQQTFEQLKMQNTMDAGEAWLARKRAELEAQEALNATE